MRRHINDPEGNAFQGMLIASPISLVIWALIAWMVWGCGINRTARPTHIPPVIRLGIYMEDSLGLERTAGVFADIRRAMREEGVEVRLAFVRPVGRCGDDVDAMLRAVMKLPMHGADKVLLLACASATDVILAALGPRKLGAAELRERKRAVAVAQVTSLETMVMGPSGVAVHEVYHLMGFNH